MSEFRFRRYVMKGAKAEGICVRADSIAAAIPKAIDLVYEDQRPVTILIADNLATKIEELEADYDEAWGLYQQSEDLHTEIRKLPKKWRETTYWDDAVEEMSMDVESVYE